MTPTDKQTAERRKAAVERLAEQHGIALDLTTTSGEDILEVLAEPRELGRWCAVTRSREHGITYLYPFYDTRAAAQDMAVAGIDDPLFAETPVEVANLDTSERYTAEFGAPTWVSGLEVEGVPEKRWAMVVVVEAKDADKAYTLLDDLTLDAGVKDVVYLGDACPTILADEYDTEQIRLLADGEIAWTAPERQNDP